MQEHSAGRSSVQKQSAPHREEVASIISSEGQIKQQGGGVKEAVVGAQVLAAPGDQHPIHSLENALNL